MTEFKAYGKLMVAQPLFSSSDMMPAISEWASSMESQTMVQSTSNTASLDTLTGPCQICAFDIDNPTDQMIHLRLIRDTGVILVDCVAEPYRAHSPESPLTWSVPSNLSDFDQPHWLWLADPSCEIIVAENHSVRLLAQSDRSIVSQLRSYIMLRKAHD